MTTPNKPAALDAVAWMYEREANEVERAATVINLTRWSMALGWTETPLTDLNKAQERIEQLEAIISDALGWAEEERRWAETPDLGKWIARCEALNAALKGDEQ